MTKNKKNAVLDIILPILLLLFAGGFAIGGFSAIRSMNPTLLQPVMDIAGEETSPTAGRLLCSIVFLVISVIMAAVSSRIEKKKPESLMLLWCLSAFGGTLLWTAIGEASWHFGFHVTNEEGEMVFVNFPRIECVQGILMFVLMLIFLLLMYPKSSFSLSAYLFTFVGNWGSHLFQIATYPIVLLFKPDLDVLTWYRFTGISNAVIFTALWLYLCFGKTKRTTKYIGSILMYDAIGSILFGTILGET